MEILAGDRRDFFVDCGENGENVEFVVKVVNFVSTLKLEQHKVND